MGAPMARRLLAAGYRVGVHDANAAAVEALAAEGAQPAATPAELIAGCDIVLMSLPTPDAAHAVALGENGLVHGAAGRIVIDMSTTGPRMARSIAEGLSASGIVAVDCPVSGGVAGAEGGRLALMTACDTETLARVRPVLEVLGKPIHVGSEPGLGQMVKIINNLISVTSLAIASEALVLGAKAGIDANVLIEIINAGTGRTNATAEKIPKHVLTRKFDFGFDLGLSSKDLRLCLEEAEALGVPMLVGSTVRELITLARARLGAKADLTEIIRPIEEWAGVEVGTTKDADRA